MIIYLMPNGKLLLNYQLEEYNLIAYLLVGEGLL